MTRMVAQLPRALRKIGAYLALLPMLCLLPEVASALEKPCRAHFQRKAFVKSAQCYQRLVKQVESKKGLVQVRRLLQDRYLEQAALAWNQAGQAADKIELRSWYKELAIQQLQKSIRTKLCQASSRCVRHLAWVARLKKEIGYVDVTIVTGAPNAMISLSGHKYKLSQKQRVQERLRPGSYVLQITMPGKPARSRTLQLRSNHKLVINVTPVKIQIQEKEILIARKIPPLVLIGYIGGSALIAGGAGFLVYSLVRQGEINAILLDPEKNKTFTDADAAEARAAADTFAIIGVVLMGTGVALFGTGLVAHILSSKGKQEPPPPTKQAGQSTLGRFGWDVGAP